MLDFHKMTVTALRIQFCKLKPRVLFPRDYTKMDWVSNLTLKVKLDTQPIFVMKMDF